ncbi:polynucleotide adenylyltransferase PcnB [Candidatus Thiodictyon syntrophicum]|jgi:poly(A) polymerase|uniref:Poly(A) polymerase I n=1 Tax=Candidatus Thiodictyon syntrophicum TaxID=1166950 RepID=A0A2K8UAJ4_9GAMM|nr:polynucleotide adenylyltransferase PcnB [Candidatus Thiodictyon syntrophicum]AUB82592.1 poly(A) polymerase [Candidatus Thiodictyon syntrophicum]
MQATHPEAPRNAPVPLIVPRAEHSISRANISEYALKVLYKLKQEGFAAHLVGGGVRDLLLGHEPKDFDVATDATPEQVRGVFRNCRLIGRRFRLAHVHFGREIIEVATFRGTGADDDDADRHVENGMIVRDNSYGSIAEDALRRDFTINALYYDISNFSLIDYTGGLDDIRTGQLRLIGDPEQRYREDPVRMLRAIRFACKLGFRVEPRTERPLFELGALLGDIAAARLFDELIKMFHAGYGLDTFEKLRHYGLFGHLFPDTEACLAQEEQSFPITFVSRGLANTDQRILGDKPVAPFFLYAVLLWEPVRRRYEQLLAKGVEEADAMEQAASEVCAREQPLVCIPKRYSLPMREIWALQPRLLQCDGKRPARLIGHPRFRAAYDFLVLRAEAGEADQDLADWWTRFQEADGTQRTTMAEGGTKRRRPRRRRRGPGAGSGSDAGDRSGVSAAEVFDDGA